MKVIVKWSPESKPEVCNVIAETDSFFRLTHSSNKEKGEWISKKFTKYGPSSPDEGQGVIEQEITVEQYGELLNDLASKDRQQLINSVKL